MARFGTVILTAALALPIAACGQQAQQPAPAATETVAATGTVTREEVQPADAGPAVTPMAPATVIQSQPGPDGSQVDLLTAKVTGDILTVTLRCSGEKDYDTQSFKVSQISVIDDATSQRIGVLKDNDGNAMVSKLTAVGAPENHIVSTNCGKKPGVLWAKFPAPPATSKTISINFPEVGPFDGVPVTR